MKQVFKWEVYVVGDVYGGRRMRLFMNAWLLASGKAFLSLCSGVVSHMMRRALTIFGRMRLQLKSDHARLI